MAKQVYVVGHSPELGHHVDDWRVLAVYDEEERANERADTEQRTAHDLVRHSRVTMTQRAWRMEHHGLTGEQPPWPLTDPGKGCCRPLVKAAEFVP